MPKFYTIHLNIMNFFKKKFDSKLIKINAKKKKKHIYKRNENIPGIQNENCHSNIY